MNNKEITKTEGNFSLSPSSLTEAIEFAKIIASSSVIPKHFQGKPGDILVAVQMGAELGLKPMQALQNIAVINGRPAIYGDSMLALVQVHRSFENIQETFDEKSNTAFCTVKRKDQEEYTVSFSSEDAKKAGLWGKSGVWSQYPKRMLQMRARGFALRDKFADALSGLILAEEAEDSTVINKIVDVSDNKENSVSTSCQSKISLMKDKVKALAKDHNQGVMEENVVQDEIIQDKAVQVEVEKEMQPFEVLQGLIESHDVNPDIVMSWLDRAGVGNLKDLSNTQIDKCIEYITTKENKND